MPSAHKTGAKDRRMRVLHVVLTLDVGGLEKFVIRLCRQYCGALAAEIAVMQKPVALLGEIEDIPVHELGLGTGIKLDAIRQLRRIIKEGGFDVVHTHNTAAGLCGALAAWLEQVPLVHTRHGREISATSGRTALPKVLVETLAKRLVSVSEDAKLFFSSFNRHKALVIRNGVDLDRFRPAPTDLRARRDGIGLGVSETEVVLGIVARLAPEKDVATLIKAAGLLRDQGHPFRLFVIGDGRCRPSLEEQSAKLGLGREVTFLGERHDIDLLLPHLDIFVLPSLTEGVSLTILEAMACGLPVVSTRVGGTPEIVDHGRTGILVAPDNAQALAGALVVLLEDPRKRLAMGEAGRERAVSEFGMASVAQRYVDVYHDVVAERCSK